MIEADADVDQVDSGGRTPLLATVTSPSSFSSGDATWTASTPKGELFCPSLHRDNAGWTPLHYAGFEGHTTMVDLLLEVGARVDATDNDGRAPILLATQEDHLSVVERLIQLGADAAKRV